VLRHRVRTTDGTSDPFDLTVGVLQGDTLAPCLFVLVMDYVLRNALKDNELGHIERLGPDHLLYIVLHSQANNSSRARGKQPHAYRHAAVEDLKKTKIDTKTWQTLAQDRKQWRVAIAQGVRAITAYWEGRQAAE
jgi:hypothetical protein